MPAPDLCTEAEISDLVHRFYARVRADRLLGPIFDAHIDAWDPHLVRMVDFWSSALRGTRRYRGAPMPAHAALPGLRPELFVRWLELFQETTSTLPNARMGERANQLARRIAQSLWLGYQLHRDPARLSAEIIDD
jgi:hemoglobin